ncbi:MAG: hypothetical protein AAFY81_02915, partial [Pseudomonadota bacterium]
MRADLASLIRLPVAAALAALVSGCAAAPEARPPIPSARSSASEAPARPVSQSAALAGVTRGPSVGTLPMGASDAGGALAAFVQSCPQLLTREDVSGLSF